MHPRLTYGYIKDQIEQNNYTLISKNYVNAHEKLEIVCDKGHKYKASWDIFNRGHRCNKCSTEKTAMKRRHSIDFIRQQLLKENYKLLSDNYLNAVTSLLVKCPYDHVVNFSWNFFQGGGRCPVCFGTPKKTIKEVADFSKSINYTLLSKTYINAIEKLKFKCPEGHIFKVSWNNFSGENGSRCPTCWKINNYGCNHPNWKGGISKEPYCEIFSDKDFKEYIKHRDGYKCLNPCCSKNYKYLAIHHIDYNKRNCKQDNLITICLSCNSKANIDREWHTSWYRAIMKQRYKFYT